MFLQAFVLFASIGFALQTYRILNENHKAQVARSKMQGVLPGPDIERSIKLKQQMMLTIALTTFAAFGVLLIAVLAATQGLTMIESQYSDPDDYSMLLVAPFHIIGMTVAIIFAWIPMSLNQENVTRKNSSA
jgi:uncharacterized BrkB/YihY/UPF0761 family membrane protein